MSIEDGGAKWYMCVNSPQGSVADCRVGWALEGQQRVGNQGKGSIGQAALKMVIDNSILI